MTTDALMEGAFDFILKPSSSDSAANRQQLRDALAGKDLCLPRGIWTPANAASAGRLLKRPVDADEVVEAAPAAESACRAVILGTSTGGPEALKAVLPRLPAELPVPVLVVQHMPATIHAIACRASERDLRTRCGRSKRRNEGSCRQGDHRGGWQANEAGTAPATACSFA